MKNLLSTAAIVAVSLGALGSPANAVLLPTTASFFTAPSNGTLTFTYEGFSAADTDQMRFTFNGALIFTNNTTPVGTVVTQPVAAGGIYRLTLNDLTVPNVWSSNPAFNSDLLPHLASTATFADFGIGAPPVVVNTNCAVPGQCYLGWEDRAEPSPNTDFNDLVFAEQFTPTPEPASLALLGSALVGIGLIRRGRNRA